MPPGTWAFTAWRWFLSTLISPNGSSKLMLLDDYFHPNGQLPAYEWAFGDVNPPVHPWAAYFVYEIDKARNGGVGDVKFLAHVFQKLLVNFTWLRGPEASGRVGVLLSLQIFIRFKVGGSPEEP